MFAPEMPTLLPSARPEPLTVLPAARYTLLELPLPVLPVILLTPLTVKVVPAKYTPPPSAAEVLPVMVVPLRFRTISPELLVDAP